MMFNKNFFAMKKTFLFIVAVLAIVATVQAQNIQFHYDFGRQLYSDLDGDAADRAQMTTTVEMFRPDKWGSTYFFVDMDYNRKVVGAYWEISREFNFWQDSKVNWLSIHVEFDGGLNSKVSSFNNAWLVGPTYSGHSKDYTKTWSLSLMYKYIPRTVDFENKKQEQNFQITGVWGIQFAKGWCTFSGFVDFWREHRPWLNTEYIFLSEPQFWVNLNKIKGWNDINLSFGGEVELSNNFVGKGFYAIPTLAAKWTF